MRLLYVKVTICANQSYPDPNQILPTLTVHSNKSKMQNPLFSLISCTGRMKYAQWGSQPSLWGMRMVQEEGTCSITSFHQPLVTGWALPEHWTVCFHKHFKVKHRRLFIISLFQKQKKNRWKVICGISICMQGRKEKFLDKHLIIYFCQEEKRN